MREAPMIRTRGAPGPAARTNPWTIVRMSFDVVYRVAGPTDATAVADLHADSWRRNYRGAFADAFLDGDVVAERRAHWATRFTGPGTTTILAEDGGRLVGFVHVVFDDDPTW